MEGMRKVAVVTGSSQGIGRGVVQLLAAGGAISVVHFAHDEAKAARTVDEIIAAGGDAFAVGADLTVRGSVAAFFEAIDAGLAERGLAPQVDILVNNAAEFSDTLFMDVSEDVIDRMFAMNFKAPFLAAQQAAARMRDGGRIINISSLSAHKGMVIYPVYGPTKGAIEALTRVLAKEFGPRAITVNVVAPGLVLTDHVNASLAEAPEKFAASIANTALRRAGEVDDIAQVVAFLASEEARWVTGQVIHANGGSYP